MTHTSGPSTRQQSERLFQAINEAANHAGVGVLVLRAGERAPDIDILYVNAAMERLLGFSYAEISERDAWTCVAPEAHDELLAFYRRFATGEPIPTNIRSTLVHRDGHRVPVEASIGVIDLDGKPAAAAFVVDTSTRDQAERELQSSREMLQRVITSAPDGILILRWPTVVFANPVAARMLEVSRPEDAEGIRISDRLTAQEAAVAHERVQRKQAGESVSQPRQYRGLPPSGREQWVEISSIPIDFEGQPAVLAFARDVTDRNAMVARLVETDKLAAMSTLAAGVAHEINNPLAYLLLNLEVMTRELRDLGGDPERIDAMRQRLHDARQGGERVKAIIRDLQALTRKDENIRGPVDLDQVLENALHMIRHELRDDVQVDKNFAAVPAVSGNPTRLEQLFFNLLGNAAHALDHSAHAQRHLRVALRQSDYDFVTAEIEDDGCGMSEDVIARAFEPFFTTKPLGVGSGLGLPICRRIVEDLGGKISVESRAGFGTRVCVSLPRHVHEDASRSPITPTRPRGRVLVVDDEKAVAESLRYALKDEHDVETAASGKEARAAIERGGDYDVVLCDLVMPVESGMDLHAYALREHPALAERFVFMTGGAFTARAAKFLSEVRAPRIEKPFELETLRALIDGMVAARRSE